MRHSPNLDVTFGKHKCYIVDKESKKTILVSMEDHVLYQLIDTGKVQECALVAKSASTICTLASMVWAPQPILSFSVILGEFGRRPS